MRFLKLWCAAAFLTLPTTPAPGAAQPPREPVDYVDPWIGSIGHLLTATEPVVQLPHGMMRLAPLTTPSIRDRYLADKIYGFPLGGALLMASTGKQETNPAKTASRFDHDLETATPYYYAATLEDPDIQAEYTVSARAVHFRFTFPPQAAARLSLYLRAGSQARVLGPASFAGQEQSFGGRAYFHIEFSKPFSGHATFPVARMEGMSRRQSAGPGVGWAFEWPADAPRTIEVRAGISYIDEQQARRNLEREIPGWEFERTRAAARAAWNQALSRIRVRGGTERQRTIFYTALWRSQHRMVNSTEDGRYWSGFDKRVHDAEGRDFYVGDGLWDTYRTLHPLQLLLDPARQVDMVRSYLRMYQQSGWLPLFPSASGDRPAMLGHHAAAFIADTYMKGYRDFDVQLAYEAMKKNAMEATMLPWRNGPLTELDRVYLEKGFFPALAPGEKETVPEVHSFERRQSVAVTLEHAYDDWCLARMAEALGQSGDQAYFLKRGANYRNVFDARTGFMSPRSADGKWVEPFDPKLSGGQGGRDYFAECNSWVYSFHVQQDVPGLIELMGGRERFIAKLDQLFTEQYGALKFVFLNQFPDMTGLTGNHAQGNEPSFHIPYLYNWAGAPWRTQRRVREIMKVWYDDSPLGICGDEDGGSMSSWYVFSAMGFYPTCPGQPVYDIASPLFEEVRLALPGGKQFTITAKNVSARNKYIQSAMLDGRPLNRAWIKHAEVVRGATLVLEMGPRPNTRWGVSEEARPLR